MRVLPLFWQVWHNLFLISWFPRGCLISGSSSANMIVSVVKSGSLCNKYSHGLLRNFIGRSLSIMKIVNLGSLWIGGLFSLRPTCSKAKRVVRGYDRQSEYMASRGFLGSLVRLDIV